MCFVLLLVIGVGYSHREYLHLLLQMRYTGNEIDVLVYEMDIWISRIRAAKLFDLQMLVIIKKY